jgi:hypothetical protein
VSDDAPTVIAGYPVHPAAELFPLINGADFDSFVKDIETNGLQSAVVLDTDGRILDGRNRARACEVLGIDVRTTVYQGSNVVQYVVSHNLHRRHLTDSQRAIIAARIAQRPAGNAGVPKRQLGNITGLPPTTSEASTLLGVGVSTVQKAKRVIADGTDLLQALAAEGGASVSTAARVSQLPPEEQDAYVEKVKAGADPVKAAGPDLKQREGRKRKATGAPAPTSGLGRNPRKHREQLDALVVAVDGACAAFEYVTELDKSIDAEEAARLRGDLSKQIRSLNRINQLIKERTQP